MSTDNLILEELPRSYRRGDEQNEIAEALTSGISAKIESWIDELENYEARYLDPKTCKTEWLDPLAAWLGWGKIWDSSWPAYAKRELLINTSYIWANRGNRELLIYLFKVFDLNVTFTQSSGWIVETSPIPVNLLVEPFSYELKVNPEYLPDSKELRLIKFLIKHFVPCWVEVRIS
ncbi:MAG: hypothetical protein F6K65_38995 [Moorea sp. SIO3C2]|nr:hypothetical protein [Moorena sp. SIO3C2]